MSHNGVKSCSTSGRGFYTIARARSTLARPLVRAGAVTDYTGARCSLGTPDDVNEAVLVGPEVQAG